MALDCDVAERVPRCETFTCKVLQCVHHCVQMDFTQVVKIRGEVNSSGYSVTWVQEQWTESKADPTLESRAVCRQQLQENAYRGCADGAEHKE